MKTDSERTGEAAVAGAAPCSALWRWLRKEWHNFWHKAHAMCGRCGNIVQANGASWRWHGVTCHFPDQCPKCGWPNAEVSEAAAKNAMNDNPDAPGGFAAPIGSPLRWRLWIGRALHVLMALLGAIALLALLPIMAALLALMSPIILPMVIFRCLGDFLIECYQEAHNDQGEAQPPAKNL